MTTQAICPACPEAAQTFIARSHRFSFICCRCGRYRLHLPGAVPVAEGRHPAEGCEQVLAGIIESLARLKLPGAVCDGRRA